MPITGGQVGIPVGSTVLVNSTVAAPGTIKKNGSLLSRAAYAALWKFAQDSGNLAESDAVWQKGQFSPGDGSTTFRIPDDRGEFPRFWDDGAGVDAGRVIGEAQGGQNAAHAHAGSISSVGGHSHSYKNNSGESSGGGVGLVTGSNQGAEVWSSGQGAHTHTLTISSDGGSEARPRNVALLACIKY